MTTPASTMLRLMSCHSLITINTSFSLRGNLALSVYLADDAVARTDWTLMIESLLAASATHVGSGRTCTEAKQPMVCVPAAHGRPLAVIVVTLSVIANARSWLSDNDRLNERTNELRLNVTDVNVIRCHRSSIVIGVPL